MLEYPINYKGQSAGNLIFIILKQLSLYVFILVMFKDKYFFRGSSETIRDTFILL